jgi:hypothetical protein|tara:strand:+ start:17674 stop:18123 length:450 start_codon:yes stop_codon:yes gene_type:complete
LNSLSHFANTPYSLFLKASFFPQHSRFFPGQRWVNISLRALHLAGIIMLGVSLLTVEGLYLRQNAAIAVLVTGLGLAGLYTFSNGAWLIQLCGQAVIAKLALVAAMTIWPDSATALFFVLLALSTAIAHAPASVRHYSIYHRRRLDHLR